MPYTGLFIFGYFKEDLFCKNKFLGSTVIWNIFSQLNKMLICTHMITLSFRWLPHPEGWLSETLASASIKAANKAVHAGRFEATEGVIVQTVPYGIFTNILVTRQANKAILKIYDSHELSPLTQLIVSGIWDSNLNTHKLIKILQN